MQSTLPFRFQHNLRCVTHLALLPAAWDFDALEKEACETVLGAQDFDSLHSRRHVSLYWLAYQLGSPGHARCCMHPQLVE